MNSERARAMRKLSALAFAGALWMTLPRPGAEAASLYLYVPSVTGENSTPGYPGAMAVQSLTVIPDNFSVVKSVDKASPTIFSDVVTAKSLHTTNVLLYNSLPAGPHTNERMAGKTRRRHRPHPRRRRRQQAGHRP
jgi:hypothetical protein